MPTSSVAAAHASAHRTRAPAVAFLLMGVAYPLVRIAVALAWPGSTLQLLFTDDAFYYQVIAENIARGTGSTFGGMVPTNGYQPLWQVILAALAVVTSGNALLFATYVVEAALFAATIGLSWAIGQRLNAPTAAVYATAYTAVVGMLAGKLFFSGMEIAVVVPLALGFVLAVLEGRGGVMLGVLTLALTLGRLDALGFPAAYAAIRMLQRRRRDGWRINTVAVAVVAGGLVAYAGINVALFGTPVPVSGQAKSLGGGAFDLSLLSQFLAFGSVGPVHLYLGAQVVVVTTVAFLLLRRAGRTGQHVFTADKDQVIGRLLAAAALGQAAQLGYYTATTSWQMWPWYFYYVPVQLLLGIVIIAQVVLRAPWLTVLRSATTGISVAASAAVLLVGASLSVGARPWQVATPMVADWIVANTAPTDVIGVGDRAGYVTWLTRRPTVQLEGLTEDRAYLHVITDKRIPGAMSERRVAFYVRSEDLTRFELPPTDGAGCREFTEPIQGGGPKSTVSACDTDLLYSTDRPGFSWRVYRFKG